MHRLREELARVNVHPKPGSDLTAHSLVDKIATMTDAELHDAWRRCGRGLHKLIRVLLGEKE